MSASVHALTKIRCLTPRGAGGAADVHEGAASRTTTLNIHVYSLFKILLLIKLVHRRVSIDSHEARLFNAYYLF